MLITHAIEFARTEHVVHFLLASYVETLEYYETTRTLLPDEVRGLPLAGSPDVHRRLRLLRTLLDSCDVAAHDSRRTIEEAVDVFAAASRRLILFDRVIMSPGQPWTVTLGQRGERARAAP